MAKTVGLNTFLSLPNPSVRISIDNALTQPYLRYPLRGRNGALSAGAETIVGDALEVLDGMSAFGVLERFEESVKLIGTALEAPLILPSQKVRSFEAPGMDKVHEQIEREPLLPEINERLDCLTEIDRLFYERAIALFGTKFGRQFPLSDCADGGASPTVSHEWGDWINFGADFHLAGVELTGWSLQEEWGVWSVTGRPRLRMGPFPAPTGKVRLTFAVRAALFSGHPEQTVTVELGERAVETWSFLFDAEEKASVRVLELPASAVDEGGYLTLTFTVARPASPLRAGISEDARELGLGIESIHCECRGGSVPISAHSREP
jgi:hypothetical protein